MFAKMVQVNLEKNVTMNIPNSAQNSSKRPTDTTQKDVKAHAERERERERKVSNDGMDIV